MNLTQAAQYTKRIIIFSIIFIFLIIVAFIGYRVWKAWYISQQPPVEIRPEQKYGELPPPKFPNSKASSASYSYSLDTTTGNLPTFDRMIKVYFMPKPILTLLAADRSKVLASKLNIKNPPNIQSDIRHVFNEGPKSLSIDNDTGNFKYLNTSSPSAEVRITESETTIVGGFRRILSTIGVSRSDLEQGPYKIQYFKYGNPYTPVASNRDADTARVSIWPNKIDDKAVVTSDPNIAPINGIFLLSANDLINYFEINYKYWPVDLETSSTYYLKPTDQAYKELKEGQGVVIQPPVSSQASITNVSLAYFMPDTYAEYLQPIYIFSGPSFIAYVPAVIYSPPPASPAP